MAMAARRLPAYMMPVGVYLGPLPRLPNFKPDRFRLAAADQVRAADQTGRSLDPLLDQVALAFEAVIGCRGATGEDDLLSLGGDSLQAVELMLELERRLGVSAPAPVFRGSRNIAELTAWIRNRAAEHGPQRPFAISVE